MIKILIVDDDELFAHMMKERLEREIREQETMVMTAASAEAAIEIIQQPEPHPVDILLVDNRLSSGKRGLELLEWLAEIDPSIDSVLFTGLDEPSIGMRAYEAGAFRYLVKPFDPNELIWIVSSIMQKRSTRYERNWLATLNEIGAAIQQALTTEMVAQTLVEGGVQLGFERARIYRAVTPQTQTYRNGEAPVAYFQGYRQAGEPVIKNFITLRMSYEQSIYVRRVYDEPHLKIFHGKAEGGYRAQHPHMADPNPPIGEWVGIPLMNGNSCSAVLLMDNPSQKKVMRVEERTLLKLFAQQASAAWERAEISEQRQRRQNANAFARSIIDRTSNEGEPNELHTLLEEVFRIISGITPTENFVVAMKHHDEEIDEKGWLYYCFHVKDSALEKPYWRPPQERSFIRYIIDHERQPLYFPEKTVAYREQHGIRPPTNTVQSIITIPLVVGNETIGGVFVEDYRKQECWSQESVDLCCNVIEHLAHYLQSAWINHQRIQLNKQLELVQSAGEKIMALARQQPAGLPENEWLWHATLTMATARYGFAFNRALLFMVEEGDSILQGRMGIGHVSPTTARKSWEQDESTGLNSFDVYIERLISKQLNTATPVDAPVRQLRFSSAESTAFAGVIATRRPAAVAKEEATNQLSPAFTEQFGEYDYWLVPANAGSHLIAILVLDTFCETEPPQTFALKYLDTLTNQVALVHENLRRSRAQRELLEISRSTVNFAYQLPLTNSLRKIANVARLVTGADTVSIYPVRTGSNPLQIDVEYITWHPSLRNEPQPHEEREPSPFMQYVLDTGRPLIVNDVTEEHPSGLNFVEDTVVIRKGIWAFVCVPIRDYYTSRIDGLLYLNYRWRCDFSDEEIQQAEAFANLLSMTLRSWHEHHDLIAERDTRDEELQSSLEILQTALQPETTEADLIRTILNKVHALFVAYDAQAEVNLGFSLLRWMRFGSRGAEPQTRFHQHFLDQAGNYQIKEAEKIKGLSGHAMQEGRILCVADVRQSPWQAIYSRRIAETRSELDIPIIGEDGRPLGVLNAESPQIGYFTETHEKMLQRIARVSMLGLDSIFRRQSMRALLSAGEEITKQTDLRKTLDVVSREVMTLIPSLSVMTAWYMDKLNEGLVLGTSAGVRDEDKLRKEYPRPKGAVAVIMKNEEPLWAEDVYEHAFFASSNFIRREEIESTAAFPLRISEESIGAIFFAYRHRHHFTRAERELLPILAQYVAIGIHDARLIETANKERDSAKAEKAKAEKEQKRLQSILRVTGEVGTILEPEVIVKNTKPILRSLYGNIIPVILFFDSATASLKIINDPDEPYEIDNPDYQGRNFVPLNADSMIGNLALESQKSKEQRSMLIVDVNRRNRQPYLPYRKNIKSTMGVTFVNTTGELLGGLVVESETEAFDEDDLQLLEGIASQIGFAIERWQQSSAIDFRNVVTDSMMWAADLAHDLNRETYHIRSWLQTLREESHLSDDGWEAVNQIEDSFDLIVRDAPWSTQKSQQIQNLAEEIAGWTREFVKQYQIQVDLPLDAKPISIELFPQILKRVIRYLARNAVKAMKYRGLITIHTNYLDESTAQIQFRDSGPGILDTDPIRSRIFKEPLDDEGRGGLGLLFARLHVEKLHGEIHLVEYEEGSGAVFCIHLPLKQSGSDENGGSDDRYENE